MCSVLCIILLVSAGSPLRGGPCHSFVMKHLGSDHLPKRSDSLHAATRDSRVAEEVEASRDNQEHQEEQTVS